MTNEPRLSFETLRAANRMRAPNFVNAKGETRHSGSDWTPNDWMVATFGELGEAANLMKKVRRNDLTLQEARSELARELADVLIYLDLMADDMGIDLAQAVRETFNAKSRQLELPFFLLDDAAIMLRKDDVYQEAPRNSHEALERESFSAEFLRNIGFRPDRTYDNAAAEFHKNRGGEFPVPRPENKEKPDGWDKFTG